MRRIQTLLFRAAAVAALAGAPPMAQAGVVYSNEDTAPTLGDCSFSTTCAANAPDRGDEFAAQRFALAGTTTLTGGSWIELDLGAGGTAVNYAFYSAGANTPVGPALFSGTSALTAQDLGVGFHGLENVRELFALPSITLGPGDYFVAIQSVSANEFNYLAQGLIHSGAAESNDGGATWVPNYEVLNNDNQGGLGVALYTADVRGGAPEPASWALMLMGFAGLGVSLRGRRRSAALP